MPTRIFAIAAVPYPRSDVQLNEKARKTAVVITKGSVLVKQRASRIAEACRSRDGAYFFGNATDSRARTSVGVDDRALAIS
jgi:hypothetical protein